MPSAVSTSPVPVFAPSVHKEYSEIKPAVSGCCSCSGPREWLHSDITLHMSKVDIHLRDSVKTVPGSMLQVISIIQFALPCG